MERAVQEILRVAKLGGKRCSIDITEIPHAGVIEWDGGDTPQNEAVDLLMDRVEKLGYVTDTVHLPGDRLLLMIDWQ